MQLFLGDTAFGHEKAYCGHTSFQIRTKDSSLA